MPPEIYVCGTCRKRFGTQDEFVEDQNRHASDETVNVQSLPCPQCHQTAIFSIPKPDFELFQKGAQDIEKSLASLSLDDRERFISGYCPRCWDIIFKDEEDEDD